MLRRRTARRTRDDSARTGDGRDAGRSAASRVDAAPLLAGGSPARAAVPVLRPRDDRPQRRRRHVRVSRRLRLVRRGWRLRDAAVRAGPICGRAADARRPSPASSARAGALVSFNGKSFDAPVLETRYLYHRLDWTGAAAARRRAASGAAVLAHRGRVAGEPACSLGSLERQVLGAERRRRPGFEVPARYFQFVRSGDPRPLVGVIEHNRLDLLSLAGLTIRLLRLVNDGPAEARDAREALAVGRLYERARPAGRARRRVRARAWS